MPPEQHPDSLRELPSLDRRASAYRVLPALEFRERRALELLQLPASESRRASDWLQLERIPALDSCLAPQSLPPLESILVREQLLRALHLALSQPLPWDSQHSVPEQRRVRLLEPNLHSPQPTLLLALVHLASDSRGGSPSDSNLLDSNPRWRLLWLRPASDSRHVRL